MNTGKFPSGKMEDAAKAQRAGQKTFKGGKDTSSEWLTKRNSVNQTYQQPIEGLSGSLVTQGGAHGETYGGAKKVGKALVVPTKNRSQFTEFSPNTKPPKGRALPIRGEGPGSIRPGQTQGV